MKQSNSMGNVNGRGMELCLFCVDSFHVVVLKEGFEN